jgi:hypothetical protein
VKFLGVLEEREGARGITVLRCDLLGGWGEEAKAEVLRGLLLRREESERWLVLLTTLGKEALAKEGGALEGGFCVVERLAVGCVCCTGYLALQYALIRFLREHKPTRLILEIPLSALPQSLCDALGRMGLQGALEAGRFVMVCQGEGAGGQRVRQLGMHLQCADMGYMRGEGCEELWADFPEKPSFREVEQVLLAMDAPRRQSIEKMGEGVTGAPIVSRWLGKERA